MKRILIVEDDRMIADLLVELLMSAGYHARRFISPLQALEFVRIQEPYDLIFLDLIMPEMSGVEFREALLEIESWRDVPIVLLSASSSAEQENQEIRAAACIRKPFELDEIFRSIELHALQTIQSS